MNPDKQTSQQGTRQGGSQTTPRPQAGSTPRPTTTPQTGGSSNR